MNYIATKQLKNKGLAVFLTILFGSIGLFYSSIVGGIVMTLIFPVAVVFLFLTGHFAVSIALACSYYIICMIWAISSVDLYNKKILSGAQSLMNYRKQDYSETEQPNVAEYNYYDQFRNPKKSDNLIWWLILTIVVCVLLWMGANTLRKNNTFSNLFDMHSEDRVEIKNQIEKTYFGISNGSYTSQTIQGSGADGLPFYNLNRSDIISMGFVPLANILGVKVQIEAKNIDVYNFIDNNTADVHYNVFVTTNDKTDSVVVDMTVKKFGNIWKLDGEKAFGSKKKKSNKLGRK